MASSIICSNTNCGYVGKRKKKSRGSNLLLIFLLFCFVVPGLLYMAFKSGYSYRCPKCGLQLAVDG